jgi:hypothetical protein
MSKEEIIVGVERLREIQKEISDLVGEAEGIVKDCDYGEFRKAQRYWIIQIKDALDSKLERWNMADSISALEGLVE